MAVRKSYQRKYQRAAEIIFTGFDDFASMDLCGDASFATPIAWEFALIGFKS
jgi:hypothetical protein